jgi:hypothetical protein
VQAERIFLLPGDHGLEWITNPISSASIAGTGPSTGDERMKGQELGGQNRREAALSR